MMPFDSHAYYNVSSLYGGRALPHDPRTRQMRQMEEDRRWANLLPDLKVPYLEWTRGCSRTPTEEPAQDSSFSIRVVGLSRKSH